MALERRKRLPDGSLSELKKIGGGLTDKEKIEQLEAVNAQLVYESMMKDLTIEELASNQADLTYQLMVKGVL